MATTAKKYDGMKASKVLKPGWRRVKFGDVVRLSKTRCQDPLAEGYERFIGLEHIDPEDLRIRRWGNVADGVTFTSVFKPSQVLFGKRRAYQRKVAVADFAGVCSGDIYVLESQDANVLLPELLPFICQTDAFFEHAVGTSAGSLSPRTNWSSLAEFEFVLPPMKEQQRIIALLQECENNLHLLEEAAVTGKRLLTSLGTEVFSGRHSRMPLGDFVEESMYGPRFSNSLYDERGSVAQLRTTDISDSGEINYRTIPRAKLRVDELESHMLRTGDLVYSRSGTCGITAVFEKQNIPTVPAAFLIRLRLRQALNPYFLNEFFLSPIGRQLSASLARGGVQQNVSASELMKQLIPVPSLENQIEVVNRLRQIRNAVQMTLGRQKQTQELKGILLAGLLEKNANV